MDEPQRTPDRGADKVDASPDVTLERGFVASLRWLVAEGDARGVRRIAVELRALREALATLDETRAARDEQARRSQDIEREVQAAIAMLGPGTSVNGNGTLVQRLSKLRDRLAEDSESRRQLVVERDAWRAMTTLLTRTRAGVHEMLEEAERGRDALYSQVHALRDRVLALEIMQQESARDADVAERELASLRARLRTWSGTVERALVELSQAAEALVADEPISSSDIADDADMDIESRYVDDIGEGGFTPHE